jgi:hypothetical protein
LLDEDPEDERPNWRNGIAAQRLVFCPFCGVELPGSLRAEWFAALEREGVDDPFEAETLPDGFVSDRWWRERGL